MPLTPNQNKSGIPKQIDADRSTAPVIHLYQRCAARFQLKQIRERSAAAADALFVHATAASATQQMMQQQQQQHMQVMRLM